MIIILLLILIIITAVIIVIILIVIVIPLCLRPLGGEECQGVLRFAAVLEVEPGLPKNKPGVVPNYKNHNHSGNLI